MNYDHIFKEGSFLQVSTWDVCNKILRGAIYNVGKQPKSDYYTGRKRCKNNRKKVNKR